MKLVLGADDGQTVCVTVSGEVTQKTINPNQDPLAELLGADCYARHVVLDMRDSPYLDSSGVGWLLKCQKAFRQSGGKLVLQALQPLVANTLRVLNLEKIFHVESGTPAPAKGVSA